MERELDSDEVGGVRRAGAPVDPLRLWQALRARWRWILGAGVLGAFLGAAVAKKLVPQTFAAKAVLAYEGVSEADSPERQTIIESITLSSNLEEVRKRLGVGMPADLLPGFVAISSNSRTNIITVDGTWATPKGAADLVNVLVDVFLESRQRVVRGRLEAEVKRLKAAVAQAHTKYTDASSQYDAFRREHGITDISQERELAITQAAELAVQADNAKAQAAAARSKLEELKDPGGGSTLSAAEFEAEAKQADLDEKRLLQARRELEVARIQYSEEHPTVRRLSAEVDTLEQRVKRRYADKHANTARRYAAAQQQATSAAARQKAAEEYRGRLRERLNKLSAVEGQAAVMLGELRVSEEALERAKELLAGAELQAARPPSEFEVLERAAVPNYALASPRKRAAIGFPLVFLGLSVVLVVLLALRRLDVRTPSEAAYWSKLPVIGASTWPREPEMLSSLMHDLDDYAPRCEGVTLIVGVSPVEAPLVRRVADWDRYQATVHEAPRLLASGAPIMPPDHVVFADPNPDEALPPHMQILTLTGPVPAHALRRAARLADRVLVVVASGHHDIFQISKIRERLGREDGIGLLLVGLDDDLALVRDRVGPIESFWYATRVASRAEA